MIQCSQEWIPEPRFEDDVAIWIEIEHFGKCGQ